MHPACTHTATRSRETALYKRMSGGTSGGRSVVERILPELTDDSPMPRFLAWSKLITLVAVRRERLSVSFCQPRHQPSRQFRTVKECNTAEQGRDSEQ